jgi:protein-S-isoprenylcysteine O-methyltransferase Ste14
MTEQTAFTALLISWFALAAGIFAVLLFVDAPYGRHVRRGWGPTVPAKLGWIVMEAPASLAFLACFLSGEYRSTAVAWVFLMLWQAHYAHRAFLYPLGLRAAGKRMPVLIAAMAFVFTTVTGYLNGRHLFTFSGGYPNSWLLDPRFVVGAAMFVAGYAVNRQSDLILRGLRGPDEDHYSIPYGGFYRWVSCPNYLGEILEWCGWAIATWSLPGLAFAVWVVANLVPRARAHHLWYHQSFTDYPAERKALVPGIW